MPDESIRDSKGNAQGSFLVRAFYEILKDVEYRLESLETIILRMRREIGKETQAKEWVDVQHTHSKRIFLRKREDTSDLLFPTEIRVQFFFSS